MFGHDGFSVILCNLNLRIHTFRFSLISVAYPSYFLCVRDSPKSFWYDRCFWNGWRNSDNLQSFLHCYVVTILQNDKWRKINQTASKYSALWFIKKEMYRIHTILFGNKSNEYFNVLKCRIYIVTSPMSTSYYNVTNFSLVSFKFYERITFCLYYLHISSSKKNTIML